MARCGRRGQRRQPSPRTLCCDDALFTPSAGEQALVISCSRSFAPMDHIFGADPRALLSVRVAGYTCSAADSVIGSIEWALSDRTPPVLIVVGNLRNDIVATAVQHVMGAGA